MENHAYVAHYDERGRLNCWTSTQMPKPVQVLIAELFELPLSRVRVVQTIVGGGFGVRLGMIGEPHVCAMAMAVPGHPVQAWSFCARKTGPPLKPAIPETSG